MDNRSVLNELGDPSQTLREMKMDSLDWIDFKIRMEFEENVIMSDGDLSSFETVQDILDFVEEQRT